VTAVLEHQRANMLNRVSPDGLDARGDERSGAREEDRGARIRSR
jgi:hypothetical protein